MVPIKDALALYEAGSFKECLKAAEAIYAREVNVDNLLLLGAVQFQLQNFAEAIFYCQQCIRISPIPQAYNVLGNALKEVGDVHGATRFLVQAIKLDPRSAAAYNNLGTCHMMLGQLAEAVETFQMCLVIDDSSVDAHCNLGTLYKATGRIDKARKCFLEAIHASPDCAVAWSNLAGLFKDQGQAATAIAYYREALRLCPACADIYSNLGAAMQDQGSFAEAKQCYATALSLRPDHALAHANLGSCLLALGDLDAAIKALRHAIHLEPNLPDAYNTLGTALRRKHDTREALRCYVLALRLKPDHPHVYVNLASAARDHGLIKEAVHCAKTATRLMPTLAEAHATLGALYHESSVANEARAHYEHALSLNPALVEARANLGMLHRAAGRSNDALTCFEAVLKIQPNFAAAHAGLAAVRGDKEQWDDAVGSFAKAVELEPDNADHFAGFVLAKQATCRWDGRADDLAKLVMVLQQQLAVDAIDDYMDERFRLKGRGRSTPEDEHRVLPHRLSNRGSVLLVGPVPCAPAAQALALPQIISARDAQRIARRHAAKSAAKATSLSAPCASYPRMRAASRLRVGYYLDANADELLGPLLHLHDRHKFYVTIFGKSSRPVEGGVIDLSSLSAAEAAKTIHDAGIHVLIASGLSDVLALRPAPLQVSYGYAGTLGADFVDYRVADHKTVDDVCRDERAICLPCVLNGHKLAYPRLVDVPTKLPTDDAFVFSYHGSLDKLDPVCFDKWMAILRRLPKSVLWLVKRPASAQAKLLSEARARGVDGQRLVFEEQELDRLKSVSRQKHATLSLQPFALNDPIAALDALWAGVPVLALRGKSSPAARVAASMLAGCDAAVVDTVDDYADRAVALALDRDGTYSALKKELPNLPLFDTHANLQHLERGLELAWGRCCRDNHPIADVVVS